MRVKGQLLIAGGGIGAMAAACAVTNHGWEARLYERAPALAEIGAGLQLGPNVTRILARWGLLEDLATVAAFPDCVQIRDASTGAELGSLPLGDTIVERYGAPYVTVHRADLHDLLYRKARASGCMHLKLGQTVRGIRSNNEGVCIETDKNAVFEGDALLGADGLLSRVRQYLLDDGPPISVGDLAYRALLRIDSVPVALRGNRVTVWLGPDLHVVQYPVRRGKAMNVVVVVPIRSSGLNAVQGDHARHAAQLLRVTAPMCGLLQDLIGGVTRESSDTTDGWRKWILAARPPVQNADEMAHGLIGLLGDAAHPMRPYMAQGAAMAIEDADELGRALAMPGIDVSTRLQRYALARWQRCARVQERSARNGRLFHARGMVRLGRDAALRALGKHVMDVPWLWGYQ